MQSNVKQNMTFEILAACVGGGAFLSLRHIYVLLYDNLQQNKLYNALNDDKWHQIRLITMILAIKAFE